MGVGLAIGLASSGVARSEATVKVHLQMVPVSKVAQPGGNVVVEVRLVNAGRVAIKAPDLLGAYQYRGWAWRWSSGAGRERVDFPSSDGMPDAAPGGPPKVRLEPDEECHWFAVLPVLQSLKGQKNANLEIILDAVEVEDAIEPVIPTEPSGDGANDVEIRREGPVVKASAAFVVEDPLQLPVRRGLDHLDFAVATATGPSWHAFGRVRQNAEYANDGGVMSRWENDDDDAWRLAWFCTRLRGAGKSLDLETWKNLQGASEEIVLVRNAHLLRAMDFRAFDEQPDADVVRSILGDVQGDDPLSIALREKLNNPVRASK